MAREIKFRGKRVDNGKWVYGYYWVNKSATRKTAIIVNEYGDMFQIDHETAGQYTGLKDRNNNEIYEGDILEITGNYNPGKYIVIWDDYRVAWWGENIKKKSRERQYDDDHYQLLGAFQKDITEIIGDIYRNPELLEVE